MILHDNEEEYWVVLVQQAPISPAAFENCFSGEKERTTARVYVQDWLDQNKVELDDNLKLCRVEAKTWLPWPEAKPLPIEETYVFELEVKVRVPENQVTILGRWLNAKHPEQDALEKRAYWRNQRGEPDYDSDEERDTSRDSALVEAHYDLRRSYYITMMMELHSNGNITVIGPKNE